MNEVYLMGRLGKDPETKVTQAGMAVCNFTVATSDKFKKDDVVTENTEWHRVIVFDRVAEICQKYLKKGSKVLVRGKVSYRQWEDKDGVKQHMTQIKAKTVEFLSPRQKDAPLPKELQNIKTQPEVNPAFTTDDLPF